MATTQPGSGPNLVRDAHTHPMAVSAKYAAFIAGLRTEIENSPAYRARADARKQRATDYARGTLGGHGTR